MNEQEVCFDSFISSIKKSNSLNLSLIQKENASFLFDKKYKLKKDSNY